MKGQQPQQPAPQQPQQPAQQPQQQVPQQPLQPPQPQGMLPEIAKAGGSDHIKQYMKATINGQDIKVATHNMLSQCGDRGQGTNNPWNLTETGPQYEARKRVLAGQYARDLDQGTDVLMLQEAPIEDDAKAFFEQIKRQSKNGVALDYRVRRGRMTIFNTKKRDRL